MAESAQLLQFPQDSTGINHWMVIRIYSTVFSTDKENQTTVNEDLTKIGVGILSTGVDPIAGTLNVIDATGDLAKKGLDNATGGLNDVGNEAGKGEEKVVKVIQIPIPENVINQFTGNWSAYDPSALDFIMNGDFGRAYQRGLLQGLLPNIGARISAAGRSRIRTSQNKQLINTPAGAALQTTGAALQKFQSGLQSGLRQSGVALNPYTQLSYKAPGFRTFNFSWLLSPTNKTEAATIHNIVQTLNKYMLPSELKAGDGAFFLYPELCDVEFYSNGSENPYLPKIFKCAITNVSTKFDNKFHKGDGSPLSVVLSINLVETVIYTQQTYDKVNAKSSKEETILKEPKIYDELRGGNN